MNGGSGQCVIPSISHRFCLWIEMEFHQLRYFLAVVSEGSFTRAAERLYITQPSLSEQVRKLEAELGTRLFERLGRSLALTRAGEALLPHAERVVSELEQARRRVQRVDELRGGRISIGVLPSVAARLLPWSVAELRRRHPDVEVTLREEERSNNVEDLVRAGDLDLGIIRLPGRSVGLEARPLLREPLVLVVPPGHHLARRHSISLSELAQEPFVAMKPGYGLRDLLEAVCRKAGFEPRVSVEVGQLASVQGLVLAGLGVTVLPRTAAGSEGRHVGLRDQHAFRALGVVWSRERPLGPAAGAFLDILRRSVEPAQAAPAPARLHPRPGP